MKRMLFNATYQEELRVAIVEGQKLIDFDIETTRKTQRRGNIYKGIITHIEQSLEACFVDYGTEKQGFLPFKEIESIYLPESSNPRNRDYSKLRQGMEVIVQVEKDERGNKGAALTTSISLPGRYLVLMPNNSKSGGISRRIDGEERNELKNTLSALEMPNNMSAIARTAALGRFTEELQWDLNYLIKLWDAIKDAANSKAGSFLIYQESNLVVRSIRDHFSPDITEILIDTQEIYEQARDFISQVMPNFVNKVKLYNDDVPLFSRFQIEHQIEYAYSRTVHLPSGGSIVIDRTEALTAIDVNSAKANKGADIEATAFAANMEAADEIARQLRLRDLGGLIVIDFIDMENSKNQRELENFFKQQLGIDRARIQMSKLSKFGLMELSRQRLQASLGETTTITCPRCNGVGSIRGNESTSVHVLRIIEEEAVKNTSSLAALQVQLPVDIATYLLNEKREDVSKIEARMKVKIILIPNLHLNSPDYKIKRINYDNVDAVNRFSYTLVENPEENNAHNSINNISNINNTSSKAAVKNIAHSQPPVQKKTLFSGLIKRLSAIFNSESKNNNQTNNRGKENNKNPKEKNKLRPVTINKGTNKVQTIKANSMVTNKTTQNSEDASQQKTISVNTKLNNKAYENSNKTDLNKKPEPTNRVKKAYENKENNVMLNSSSIHDENIDNYTTNKVTEPAIIDDKSPTVNHSSAIVEENITTVKQNNTITEQIDLGELQLVNTDIKFMTNQSTIIVEEPVVKRYNDLEIKPTLVKQDIVYELVETKPKQEE